MARTYPAAIKKRLLAMSADQLSIDFDLGKHLTPDYNPWDQRLCLVPDSDLF
ncbi:hypothetical protein [Candidatus Phycosocius spiralis]|uniref:Uncharacterized protein n=1 Tax=Candidatus Phycosocius spiralis TaxID=2815099 RepID=A0ABQ4PXS0_9PROT|nr:hypothetical protein [Candidatus Phycosocius spiralis]GIU67746.1 hypothetical protein PsB1_1900 [Candidatus Phycosocius spiralis]